MVKNRHPRQDLGQHLKEISVVMQQHTYTHLINRQLILPVQYVAFLDQRHELVWQLNMF